MPTADEDQSAYIAELEGEVRDNEAAIDGLQNTIVDLELQLSTWEDWAKDRQVQADQLERALRDTP
jgi:hypothetical protein